MSQTTTPISDLTYRNYDGPLASPEFRWWVIAKMTIRKASRITILRVAAGLAGWYYVMMIMILFFLQAVGNSPIPNAQQFYEQYLKGMVWKDQFIYGFSYSQHLLLVVSLILGAGAIANDSRANALLVYLSKPTTRLDYVLGKWVGVFIPILTVITIPTVVFYAYGVFSFKAYGFISQDPWLLPKMLAVLVVSATLHTSLILGISSLFKQGTIAGAVYSGIYFFTFFFTGLLSFLQGRGSTSPMMTTLLYSSVDGIQIGLAKAVLVPSGTMVFGLNIRNAGPPLPIPAVMPMLAVVLALTVGSLCLVWSRVRAVEVVG